MDDAELLRASKAWPVAEATKLLARVEKTPPDKGYVLFETGYGPSGLPHIGTFGEVVRTTMVRQAFARLSDLPTRLFAFSDDMDGLRKVPDNIPNREMVARAPARPLTAIPDPFGTHESFGAHMNNARLRAFLDGFGFEYDVRQRDRVLRAGRFDAALLRVLERYEAVHGGHAAEPRARSGARPTARSCRSARDRARAAGAGRWRPTPTAGTIVYRDEAGRVVEKPVTGGRCKLQWRADWAMRWAALGVDYEMSGKDLIDSVELVEPICRVLGGRPPEGFTYELFLDEKGQKISKSKGNGLTVERVADLRHRRRAWRCSCSRKPRAAKRLYFDVIPRAVDDYLHLARHAIARAGPGGARSTTRSGTSMTAIRRTAELPLGLRTCC